jgi:hypothetical protein
MMTKSRVLAFSVVTARVPASREVNQGRSRVSCAGDRVVVEPKYRVASVKEATSADVAAVVQPHS